MRLFIVGIALTLAGSGLADTVTLKSGRVLDGTYLGGSSRQVRLAVGDGVQTLDVSDISKIEFGSPASAPAEPLPPPRSESNVFRPTETPAAAPPPARAAVELPAGSNIVVRMIDGVDSDNNTVGQTFAASLDEPIIVNGETLVPRGADVVVKLVDSKESGKLTGRSELTLDLVSVKVDGKMVDINTQTVSMESSSRGERTAKVAGGTAALGAIIGAIAGGGRGAAIGAGAGAAAGAGAEVVTKGQRVKIPSETRLTFVTDTPVRI
ncbi:MAG TPA: hypothetical protein VG675_05670 [Bryobacteraceae bacterium]|nr:hypothetical protein [Bryobacteraceae bacterium]